MGFEQGSANYLGSNRILRGSWPHGPPTLLQEIVAMSLQDLVSFTLVCYLVQSSSMAVDVAGAAPLVTVAHLLFVCEQS